MEGRFLSCRFKKTEASICISTSLFVPTPEYLNLSEMLIFSLVDELMAKRVTLCNTDQFHTYTQLQQRRPTDALFW